MWRLYRAAAVVVLLFTMLSVRLRRSAGCHDDHRVSPTPSKSKLAALVEHTRLVTALLMLAALVVMITAWAESRAVLYLATFVVFSTTDSTGSDESASCATVSNHADSTELNAERGWHFVNCFNPLLFLVLGCACHVHPQLTTALASAHACVLCVGAMLVVPNGLLLSLAWWAVCFTVGCCALCDFAAVALRKCCNAASLTSFDDWNCLLLGTRRQPTAYKCGVCFDPMYTILSPKCGHAGFCFRCAAQLTICPLCREPINRPFITVYLPDPY